MRVAVVSQATPKAAAAAAVKKKTAPTQVARPKAAVKPKQVGICIKIDESCIKNDGFCIKNGDFNANIKGMRHGQKLVSTPAVPAAT